MKRLWRRLRRSAVLIGVIVAFAANPAFVGQAQALSGISLPSISGLSAGNDSVPLPEITSHPCLSGSTRHFEVCFAYIVNCSYEARLPYYNFGNSDNSSRGNLAAHRLSSRYQSQGLALIRSQVAGWNTAEPDVSLPKISILSVNVSADENTAVVATKETWRVSDAGGHVLFEETNQPHTITMHRVKGIILHKWVVYQIH
jgi:hypothetical protein